MEPTATATREIKIAFTQTLNPKEIKGLTAIEQLQITSKWLNKLLKQMTPFVSFLSYKIAAELTKQCVIHYHGTLTVVPNSEVSGNDTSIQTLTDFLNMWRSILILKPQYGKYFGFCEMRPHLDSKWDDYMTKDLLTTLRTLNMINQLKKVPGKELKNIVLSDLFVTSQQPQNKENIHKVLTYVEKVDVLYLDDGTPDEGVKRNIRVLKI